MNTLLGDCMKRLYEADRLINKLFCKSSYI